MMYGFTQVIGNLAMIDSYEEVKTVQLPTNGEQTMFIVKDKDEMYLVSANANGHRNIQGYNVKVMPSQQEITENRLTNLETMMLNIQALLEGKVIKNESNTTTPRESQTNKCKSDKSSVTSK